MTLTALGVVGCSSDGDTTETGGAITVATIDESASPDSSATAPTLTGTQICERLSVSSVAADLGIDVVTAEAADTGTPQCAYGYVNDTGVMSNLTVAAMRPVDVGGTTGADAFEYVLSINRGIGGDDVEEQEIDAGDGAVRLSGASLHLGVVRVGDHVYTLIVPVGDAEIDAVDHLIATMATTLS
ncbi:MAG: hypothetical protein WBP59_00780 [Ilumatobacteraceae bacterium]